MIEQNFVIFLCSLNALCQMKDSYGTCFPSMIMDEWPVTSQIINNAARDGDHPCFEKSAIKIM
jgi:hypothetical protein